MGFVVLSSFLISLQHRWDPRPWSKKSLFGFYASVKNLSKGLRHRPEYIVCIVFISTSLTPQQMKLIVQDKLQEPSLVDSAVLRPVIEELLKLEAQGFMHDDMRYYVKA
jgi:hypothetical protein